MSTQLGKSAMFPRVLLRSSLLALVLSLVASSVLPGPASAGSGRTGAPILDLPHRSPLATSLGEAFVTRDGDIDAFLWNPAGLSTLDRMHITASRSDFSSVFGGDEGRLYYAKMGVATPLDEGDVVGAFMQLNGQGTIDITTGTPGVIATEGLGTNWVLGLSYASVLAPRLRGGVTGKVIHLALGVGFEQASSATAYAVDFGGQFDLPLPTPVTLGASVQNLGTRVQFKDAYQSDPLPRKFHAGASVVALDEPGQKLTLSGRLSLLSISCRRTVRTKTSSRRWPSGYSPERTTLRPSMRG